MVRPQKNSLHRVKIDQVASNAMGIARLEGYVVFVKGALAGELCDIRLLKAGASFGYARIERIVEASDQRVSPDCPHYPLCGGCDLRHMTYDEELRTKLGWVQDALSRSGGCSVVPMEIIGAPESFRLRNKAVYSLGSHNGEPVAGFYRSRSHDIVPVERCLLQDERADKAVQAVQRWMKKHGVEAGQGCIRHVFVRSAFSSGQTLVCLVSARRDLPAPGELVSELRRSVPTVSGVLLNINRSSGNAIFEDTFVPVWGAQELEDTLCSLRFRISPASFYQVNPAQAELLYQKAIDFAALTGKERVLDLYCGIGTISLCLARRAFEVIGIEEVPDSVRNAERNAELNGISNARFFCCDAGRSASLLGKLDFKPEVIVVDPPRKGLRPDALQLLSDLKPDRIVYVSCDPATLSRDVRVLRESGWECTKAACVDMFPRTANVETVVLLSRETCPQTIEVKMP